MPGTVKPNLLKQRQRTGKVDLKSTWLILKIKFLLFLHSGRKAEMFFESMESKQLVADGNVLLIKTP